MSEGLAHWERCVVDNCIAMLKRATVEGRAEALALLCPALRPPVEVPSDLEPVHGSFHDPDEGGEQ